MMKLLLLHLSDIHLKAESNPILDRVTRISEAAQSLDPETSSCVVVSSGDIAFSGRDEEYDVAGAFFAELRHRLTTVIPKVASVEAVFVPGNHDCYIPSAEINDPVRNTLLDSAVSEPEKLRHGRLADEVTRPQDAFFKFMHGNCTLSVASADNRLFYTYELRVGNHNILFECYNTAWMVRRDLANQQGSLVFPPHLLPESTPLTHSYRVSVFHHPYNWLVDHNARAFRNKVSERSHLALSGHEHGQDDARVETHRGEQLRYLEGGVLQDSDDTEVSGFNAVLVDLDNEKQRIVRFSWDGEIYRPVPGSEAEYRDYSSGRLDSHGDFRLSDDFLAYLDDAGASLEHPIKGKLTLNDAYIDLSLQCVDTHSETGLLGLDGDSEEVALSSLPDQVQASRLTFVTGSDKSGKTIAAKVVFRRLLGAGLVPVLIDGRSLKRARDRELRDLVRSSLEQQYLEVDHERYDQLLPDRRVLIIDNFEDNALNRSTREEILRRYSQRFGRILVFSNAFVPHLDEILYQAYDLPPFRYFRIKNLSHEQIESTVQKWTRWGTEETLEDDAHLTRLDATRLVVRTVLGRKSVPPKPIFVLSTLQFALRNMPLVDTTITSYGMGYVFEQLIRQALTRTLLRADLSGEEAYLSFVAYRLYKNGVSAVDEPTMRSIHREYCQRFKVAEHRYPFEAATASYVSADIFQRLGGTIGFKYKYAFNYFIALYLRERLSDEETQRELWALAENLHNQSNADVMLFLTHLSKDRLLYEIVLGVARGALDHVPSIDLDADVGFLNSLQSTLSAFPELYYEVPDPLAERRRRARTRDSYEDGDLLDASDTSTDPGNPSFYLAPNAIQVMGQLLRNYPRALEGDVKYMLTEESYLLSLRLLKVVFDVFESSMTAISQDFIEVKREGDSGTDQELAKLRDRFSDLSFMLAQAFTIAILTWVVECLYSNELEETFAAVSEKHGSPAVQLIDCALRLNEPVKDWRKLFSTFDSFSSNPLAAHVLRALVYDHLRLFKIPDRGRRQQVCDKFRITYAQRYKLDLG